MISALLKTTVGSVALKMTGSSSNSCHGVLKVGAFAAVAALFKVGSAVLAAAGVSVGGWRRAAALWRRAAACWRRAAALSAAASIFCHGKVSAAGDGLSAVGDGLSVSVSAGCSAFFSHLWGYPRY